MIDLTPEDLNRGNPNHDSFWQARGFKKRPKDWKQRIANEKAAKAKRLQQEQKATARQARIEREQAAEARALRDRRAGLSAAGGIEAFESEYDPFRRSRERVDSCDDREEGW